MRRGDPEHIGHAKRVGFRNLRLVRLRVELVGRHHERLLAGCFQQLRKLSNGRRLAGPVDADDEHDVRQMAVRAGSRGRLDRREDGPDLVLDGVPEIPAGRGLLLDRIDDALAVTLGDAPATPEPEPAIPPPTAPTRGNFGDQLPS